MKEKDNTTTTAAEALRRALAPGGMVDTAPANETAARGIAARPVTVAASVVDGRLAHWRAVMTAHGYDDRHGNAALLADEITRMELGENPKGLLLWGGVGRGKTMAAQIVAQALRARFVTAYDAAAWWATEPARFAESLDDPSIYTDRRGQPYCRDLVLDDIGVEQPATRYGQRLDVVAYLIDRFDRLHTVYGTRLVVTTNMSREAMESRYDERIVSRIYGLCKPVKLNGPDRRREVGA